MFDFLNKPYPFNTDLKYSLELGMGLSIGVFLFILFFQPLELDNQDIDSYVLTIAGFAVISFLVISLLRIILPWAFRGLYKIERWDLKREIFLLLLIWILTSVAFSFYLAYVGKVPMTMYLGFKIVLICLVLPVMIVLINEIHNLRDQLVITRQINKELEEQQGNNQDEIKPPVELLSENRAEKLTLQPEALLLVRSAENYVEIIFRENHAVQKKLLRATMNSIENQLRPYPEMVRCHRTSIVNTRSVEKLQRTAQGIKLRIFDYEEEIPVSRQYLLGVKSALERQE